MTRIHLIPFLFSLLILSVFSECPTVTVQPDFNITEYVRAKWYIHQQMVVSYLPKENNYCVTAEYTMKTETSVKVHNYANQDKVNGPVYDSDNTLSILGGICGEIQDEKVPAKLLVGPCRVPFHKFTYGPYWIIAAGPSPSNYEWALVSGGQPTNETPDGCRTGTGVNGSGLWIFTRSQKRDENLISMIRNQAKTQGFDLSVLNDVEQEGCTYAPKEKTLKGKLFKQ